MTDTEHDTRRDLVGRVVGGYRLERLLGVGAVGRTYQARHAASGRAAAVKVVHARLAADPDFPERFERAAAQAAGLRHPGVAAVEAAGADGTHHFVASPFHPAGSLRALVGRGDGPPPLALGVHVVRDAAAAVAAAHALGVLHRDLKPENVLLAGDDGGPAARVVDFGLVRLAESGATLGGELAAGSPAYLSPEQCRGTTFDARGDVYALGVVLYEAVAGHPPFQARTLGDAVAKHLGAVPAPPSAVARGVPASLDAVVLRCLAKRPEDRFQSADELVRALDAVLAELRARPGAAPVVWHGDAPRVVLVPDAPGVPATQPARDGDPRRIRVRVGDDAPPAAASPAAPIATPAPARLAPVVLAPAVDAAAPPRAAVAPAPAAPRRVAVQLPDDARDDGAPRRGAPAGAPAAPPAESRRITVALDQPTLDLTPGVPAFVRVTVVNGGTTVDHFDVEVDGVPAEWVSGARAGLQLNPGDRGTVALTVVAPAVSASLAGAYVVTVRARSRDVPAESGAADARWTVLPFARSTLAVAPARARAWRRARFAVTVANQGNAPAHFALAADDEEHRVRCTFAEEAVALEPGAERRLSLAAVAPLRLLGGAETRTLTVRADPAAAVPNATPAGAPGPAAPPLLARAQLVHRALVPVWLPPLLLAGAAALALVVRARAERAELQVAVTPARLPLAVGGTGRLTASVTDRSGAAAADQTVEWLSQDTAVALVSPAGVVRARREGLAVVVARRDGRTATAEVAVGRAAVGTIVLAPRTIALRAPASAQLRAEARSDDGAVVDAAITFTSSDPTVATVGGNGRVVAKAAGSATITAQADAKVATAEVVVTGPPTPPPAAPVAAPPAPVVAAAPAAPAAPAPPPARPPAPAPAPKLAAGPDDCVAYNPNALRVVRQKGAGFVVTDGGPAPLLRLESEADARRALALAQRHTAHCFLGRASARPNKGDVLVEFWIGDSGARTVIRPEDCVAYDKAALRTFDLGAAGIAVADSRVRILAADTPADAARALALARGHSAICFIGRGNRQRDQRAFTVQYWK